MSTPSNSPSCDNCPNALGEALDLIKNLLSIPSDLSVTLLRLDPIWDTLRHHPSFQALLEEYDTN